MTQHAPTARPRVADLAAEAVAGLASRPARAVLTALGTVLGVTTLVTSVGMAQTAGNQILTHIDEAVATRVTAQDAAVAPGGPGHLPWDSADRVTRLPGVVAAGATAEIPGAQPITTIAIGGQTPTYPATVYAVTPRMIGAVQGQIRTGRMFDARHDHLAEPVAVLGDRAAGLLRIDDVSGSPRVFLAGQAVTVIGILDPIARQDDLGDAILVPVGYARQVFRLPALDTVLIRTRRGAAPMVGRQVGLALDPNDPTAIDVAAPPDPIATRAAVRGDVSGLLLLLAGMSLVIGALGIANVTLVGVLERRSEIGLRNALGASRLSLATQFVAESGLIGTLGGLLGGAAGVLAVVVLCAIRRWVPVLDLAYPLAGPVLGAIVGLAAGIYPAWKAASMSPIDALKG